MSLAQPGYESCAVSGWGEGLEKLSQENWRNLGFATHRWLCDPEQVISLPWTVFSLLLDWGLGLDYTGDSKPWLSIGIIGEV